MNSTSSVSNPLAHHRATGEGLTKSTQDEGNHEPGPRREHLPAMQRRGQREEDDENDRCCYGRIIIVQLEILERVVRAGHVE
jgi:hypothetical protein